MNEKRGGFIGYAKDDSPIRGLISNSGPAITVSDARIFHGYPFFPRNEPLRFSLFGKFSANHVNDRVYFAEKWHGKSFNLSIESEQNHSAFLTNFRRSLLNPISLYFYLVFHLSCLSCGSETRSYAD